MIRVSIQSSRIHSIGYNPESLTLELQFYAGSGERRKPGPIYTYRPFTAEDHAAFMAAESKGSYFGQHIKPNAALTVTKIEPPAQEQV